MLAGRAGDRKLKERGVAPEFYWTPVAPHSDPSYLSLAAGPDFREGKVPRGKGLAVYCLLPRAHAGMSWCWILKIAKNRMPDGAGEASGA